MTNYRNQLNSTATSCLEAGVLYPEVAARLMERLTFMKIEPQCILELGCGVGNLSLQMQKAFPEVQRIVLDIAEKRLQLLPAHISDHRVCADATALPFANNSVDFVVANLMSHWVADQSHWLKEAKRVLRVNGLLLFSFFATDTLKEMGKAKHPFYDMHDMGDLLVRVGFSDPILDSEKFTLEYDNSDDALQDLNATAEIALLNSVTANTTDEMQVTYEVVYAHAWKSAQPMTSKVDQEGMVTISLDQIGRR